nr:hypothetical protein [Tanacetum cinerariifolium]
PRPDAVIGYLTPSLDRSRRRQFMPATPPPRSINNTSSWIRCREVPIFDVSEPQPQPLPNCPSLDASLGNERGSEPPIKPPSPDSFRMKEVDHLTIHTPLSPHVASFHLKDTYCDYHPCIDDPKKHYGFKLGFCTWMAFGGNTCDLGSFREETDKITDLHQIHEEVLFIEREGGVAGINRRRRDLSSDGVRYPMTASGRG